jgi:hypothetical protein
LRNGLRIRQNDDSCIGICQNAYPFGPFVRHEYFLHECSRWAVFDRFETWAISDLGMRRFQANDRTMLMGLLTDVVRSGVFGDHLLAATRRTLYEHRIIIPGRRRLSELAGEAATTVERHALEVIEREIPAATRAQWSAALSQSIGDTHCEFSEKLSFFALRTSLKKARAFAESGGLWQQHSRAAEALHFMPRHQSERTTLRCAFGWPPISDALNANFDRRIAK